MQANVFSSSLAVALQCTLPVSGNIQHNDCSLRSLRSGMYFLNVNSAIQYYDPDASSARCGLSAQVQNVLFGGAGTMLANNAAVIASGEVGCFQ